MTVFRSKRTLEGRQFLTNNEPDNKNLNDIVLWVNQGREAPGVGSCHAWHNGTNIFLIVEGDVQKADVGDYIVRTPGFTYFIVKQKEFEETYEPVLPRCGQNEQCES